MPGLPEPGVEWAGFQIEQRIGAGTTGAVYVAHDNAGDRRIALKVLSADAGSAAQQRFLRESRVAAGLDHPRIVRIHDVGDHDGVAFVVMEHVGGGDLAQQIHVAPLTVDRTRSVLGQLAAALDRVHREGLVHRGVEPANILCAADSDDVFLADFGAPGASLRYAAPEQIRGEVSTPATDVYGMGCTLFECLTGRVPFPGDTPDAVTAQHLDSPPPRVTELRPDLPDEFDEIVARAMAKAPGDRHATTRHLAEAVALVRVGDPPALGTTALTPTAFPPTAAIAGVSADVPDEEPDEVPAAGRSVFDDPSALETTPTSEPDPTTAVPVAVPPTDGPVDGAAFGIYEDDGRRSRMPMIVASVLVLATLVVGALAWRAINTDAELGTGDDGASDTTTTTDAAGDDGPVAPTVEAAEALVPGGIDTCVAPEGDAATADPVVLQCPIDGVPETLSLELFSTDEARDERLAAFASDLEISGRDDAECALGRAGRHDYASVDGGGVVLCRARGGLVDFVWTRSDAPVVLHASGGGRFTDYEQAWEELAGRTDAAFPTSEEQQLLDAIPGALVVDCARDLPLVLATGGEVAAVCRPPDAEPSVVSWVLFSDTAPMNEWIQSRRDSLDENNFDTTDDGCTPQGFGQVDSIVEEPVEDPDEDPNGDPDGDPDGDDGDTPATPAGPPPDAAFVDYDLDGSSGQVLCFVNTSGQNALFWTRDGSRIASIAVSERSDGASMVDLLSWWRDGGNLP